MADVLPFPTGDDLLAIARSRLGRRRAFQEYPPAEQESEVQRHARELALYDADIGKSAIRIGAAFEALIDAIEKHLSSWPDDDAAESASRSVIAAAGLDPQLHYMHGGSGPRHFSYLASELQTWLPVLQVACERLEVCDAPDMTISHEERASTAPRAAA